MERLNNANFDIQWLTRRSKDENKPLFYNAEKGDFKKVREFMMLNKDKNLK